MTQEYEPFYGDFGPLNMGHTFMFCTRTASLLQVTVMTKLAKLAWSAPDVAVDTNAGNDCGTVWRHRRFHESTAECAQMGASQEKMVYLYTAAHAWKRANAAALVRSGCFSLLRMLVLDNLALSLAIFPHLLASCVQVGIFQTLFLNVSPAEAYSRLAAGAPYETFRDASTGESMLPLSVMHIVEVGALRKQISLILLSPRLL